LELNNEYENIHIGKVKCPQCGGNINSKWCVSYSFIRHMATFVAECWTPDNPDLPRHIFAFEIETTSLDTYGMKIKKESK